MLNEIVAYCKEVEPVGALLVTGEWGCGKTYMIENDLRKKLAGQAVVVRVSLFGVSSIDKIHESVKREWFYEYCDVKGRKNVIKKIQKTGETISQLEFLPDSVKELASTNWLSFVEIKNKIDNKTVVLVFDDLERCCINSVDVFGGINNYIENQKMNVIIVANQDKIIEREEENGFPYQEIKEKIVQRTVEYIPDYSKVVHAVIENAKFPKSAEKAEAYKKFLRKHEQDLLELFAPESDEIKEDVYEKEVLNGINSSSEMGASYHCERPHNIRSLKCAIQDFYRIYKILNNNDFNNLEKWMCAFVSCMITYKAGIVVEGDYGTLFSDKDVRSFFPDYQDRYMFQSVKEWILYGTWNEKEIEHEVKMRQEQERARTPEEIIRTSLIIDAKDDLVEPGFKEVLLKAYAGTLSLDEYVCFIKNCYFARKYKPNLYDMVKWEKIMSGINQCFENMTDTIEGNHYLLSNIEDKIKQDLNQNELEAYQTIEGFNKNDILIYRKNRKFYIDKMKSTSDDVFAETQNKQFDVFDVEMAEATAYAFERANNLDKHLFVLRFDSMWERIFSLHEVNVSQTKNGMEKLIDLLQEQKESLEQNQTFAIMHTENFIKLVAELQNSVFKENEGC